MVSRTVDQRSLFLQNGEKDRQVEPHFLCLRPRLHEQIKPPLFAQIRPELLHMDRELEQLKEVLFAHINAALETNPTTCFTFWCRVV